MARTAPPSPKPLPKSALKIKCIDCVVRAAEAARVKPTPDAVGKWVDSIMMGSVEACSFLSGMPTMQWGGASFGGSGASY